MHTAKIIHLVHFMAKAKVAYQRCTFSPPGTDILLTMTQAFKQVVEIAKETPFFFSSCVNTTFCYPYSADFNVRAVLYRNTAIPDFPAILDGIHGALNGDPTYFIDGPPSLEDVVAMPILCNDYSQFKNLTYLKF
jgi:hypothetical protein